MNILLKYADEIMKQAVNGSYPQGTAIMGPDNKDTVQPVGGAAQPVHYDKQKTSDVAGDPGRSPRAPAPKGETNMRGDGNQIAAIPDGIIGAKVGPRSMAETQRKYYPKLEKKSSLQERMQISFLDEFQNISKEAASRGNK